MRPGSARGAAGARRRQPPIADYGFLSDCHSAALVDRDGSVDWWCVPRFDSPSVFGRLLDGDAGHWSISPVDDFETDRHYVEGSLVLRSTFRTAGGEVTVTDAAALAPGTTGHELGMQAPHTLLRRIVGVRGTVALNVEFAPRMEYGRTEPHLRPTAAGVIARGGPAQLSLVCPVPLYCSGGTARAHVLVGEGDVVEFRATYAPSFGAAAPGDGGHPATIEATLATWRSWSALHQGYAGRFQSQVSRSATVLQGLTYQPSGAVVAAATTSLPERMGGDLNFDYRYAWLRDLSLTVRSLWIAACPDEPTRLFDWFTNAAGTVGDELFQIMYGVGGERDLSEHTLEHLRGYHDSRPVRIGNQAWTQVQLDVLGEVLDAAHLLRHDLGELDEDVQKLLVVLADRAAAGWAEPDAGMWEARDRQRQYVSSKVMCWVALDRAVALADRLGDSPVARGDGPARWAIAREEIRAAVLEQAWSPAAGAYSGAFASDDLDASVLLLPLVGFLPADDERMRATIDAIEAELGAGGLVRRWRGDDSGFLICTFWLAECLALAGEVERAEAWFASAAGYANDLGLLSEEAVPDGGALLGNFPQAFSHVGLVNAAWRISEATRPQDRSCTHQQGDAMTAQRLLGKTALITGSDSGIGQASAMAFAAEGADVVITYRHDADGAADTRKEVEAAGQKAVVVQLDISDEASVAAAFDQALESFGTVDILMNNAGVDASGTEVADLTTEVFDTAIRTNVYGAFFCCRRFVQERKKQGGGGKIINVTSVHEDVPLTGGADYDCSKGAIRNLTRTLALELAPLKINVNNLAPGMVLTPFNQAAIDDPDLLDKQVQSIPFKRAAEPAEIARLALFLASGDSDYCTGSTFTMDGGLTRNLGQGA